MKPKQRQTKKLYFDLKEGYKLLLQSGDSNLEAILDVIHLKKDGMMLATLIGDGDPRTLDFPLHKYVHISNNAGLQNLGSRGYGRRTHMRLQYTGVYWYEVVR